MSLYYFSSLFGAVHNQGYAGTTAGTSSGQSFYGSGALGGTGGINQYQSQQAAAQQYAQTMKYIQELLEKQKEFDLKNEITRELNSSNIFEKAAEFF